MALRAKHRLRRLGHAVSSLVVDEAQPAAAPAPRDIGGLEEMVLHGLQHQPHVYQGTVHPVIVAERRARNRRSRKARRLNRNR